MKSPNAKKGRKRVEPTPDLPCCFFCNQKIPLKTVSNAMKYLKCDGCLGTFHRGCTFPQACIAQSRNGCRCMFDMTCLILPCSALCLLCIAQGCHHGYSAYTWYMPRYISPGRYTVAYCTYVRNITWHSHGLWYSVYIV